MNGARRPAPVENPVTLTIAGSDSGGGAGIQADLKTMEALGAFGTSAITSLTAQNTLGVESTYLVPAGEVEAQIDAIHADFDVRAVKTGMLGVEPVVETVTRYAVKMDVPFVVDPVMVAASGDRLLEPGAEAAYEALVDEATVVTPNTDEAEVLTGRDLVDETSMRAAGTDLVGMGAGAALVKGGHLSDEDGVVTDVLVTEDETHTYIHPRVETTATHGSGCTLSSAIATRIAHGDNPVGAVEAGVDFMARAIRYPLDVGEGPGAVHHLASLRERADRGSTQDEVERVVERLVEAEAAPLVPEVGMNVVGATPYAESSNETAAVEGRITRTTSGIRPNRGTRFGASSHVARFLLSARESDPSLRFAANLRFDDAIEAALRTLDADVVEIDRSNEPTPDLEGSTMGWVARHAFQKAEGAESPAVIYDRGAVGKEAMTRLLAPDATTLAERALSILDAV